MIDEILLLVLFFNVVAFVFIAVVVVHVFVVVFIVVVDPRNIPLKSGH